MKIILVSVGKKHDVAIEAIIDDYYKRINKYFNCSWAILPAAKKATEPNLIKKEEAQTIIDFLQKDDFIILLDETGKNISSPALADKIQYAANASFKRLVFIIGGAYGVSENVKNTCNFVWSLSLLVFPHMLVRCILTEQVYRACTILKNEKYHH